jgi:hypothetical protein
MSSFPFSHCDFGTFPDLGNDLELVHQSLGAGQARNATRTSLQREEDNPIREHLAPVLEKKAQIGKVSKMVNARTPPCQRVEK